MQKFYASDEGQILFQKVNNLFIELSRLVGKVTVIAIMRSALRKSIKQYPMMSYLKIDVDGLLPPMLIVNQPHDVDPVPAKDVVNGISIYMGFVANILSELTGAIMLSILEQSLEDVYQALDEINEKIENGEI